MSKSIFFSILSVFLIQNSHAAVCGGVDSEVLNDVSLNLESLYNDNVYEEGLSFHEYPGFRIELEADGGYYLSVGAAGFSRASRKEFVCNNGEFEMQVDFDGKLKVLFKDFKYENNTVVGASVYNLNKEGEFTKLADFTTEGKKVVYAYLSMIKKSSEATALSQYVNEGDDLEIQVDTLGDYEIKIGSISINTHVGNEHDAIAVLSEEMIYVEAPGLNIYLEIKIVKASYDGEIEEALVFVGELDSAKPAVKLGSFE